MLLYLPIKTLQIRLFLPLCQVHTSPPVGDVSAQKQAQSPTLILSLFGRIRKISKRLSASSFLSLCLAVCPHGTRCLPLYKFSWNLTFENFSKICLEKGWYWPQWLLSTPSDNIHKSWATPSDMTSVRSASLTSSLVIPGQCNFSCSREERIKASSRRLKTETFG
jgi:hypothetical protein